MTIEEQYIRILEKGKQQEIIPFLQALTSEERKSLAPTVKKLAKEYFTFQQRGNTWESKATEKQRTIINYAFFVCYNKKEFEKENQAWLLAREHLEKFFSWYIPSWLSDYINSFAERDWLPYQLDYDYLVELRQRELIQPSPHLLARVLVPFVYENKDRQNHFVPERLLKHEVTLNEHIWYLFQYETTIHVSNHYLYSNGKRIAQSWLDVFQNYVASGNLDKQRVLQEALLASNRNFNKNLSGWFAELFLQLKPCAEEVLLLQPELFNLFAAPHSKVVTTALQACKSIVDQPQFDYNGFLDSTPILLSSATKTVVSSTLQLLEKLAKKYPEKRAQICQLAAGVLIHKEDSLQTRAAKLIQKFGRPEDEDLKAVLLQYSNALFSGAKTLLQPYLTSEETPKERVPTAATMKAPHGSLTEATALPFIDTIDELIFLTAQAFDNNESWHMDALPAALIRLQGEIRGEHLQKMEPAIQRALKLYFGDWRSTQGDLDFLLACFFLDYGLWLVEQHTAESKTARELYRSYLSKTEQNKKVWEEHGTNVTFLGNWKEEERRFLYSAYRKLLDVILYGLKDRIDLPLLCEPTHAPAWIDPVVLVQRLYQHQKKGATPDDTDLQIALSRCWLYGTEAAIQLAREKLQGELQELMLFLLDKDQYPTGPFTMEAAWMIAALSKSPATVYPELQGLFYSQKPRQLYTGQYPYQILVETYTYQDHHWENGKLSQVKKTAQRKVIRLDLSAQQAQKPKEPSGLKKFFNKFTGKEEAKAPESPLLLYDYLRSKERWLSVEDRDIRRLYLLTPNNPEPLLAFVIDKCLSDPSSFGETAKRLVIRVLEVLLQTWRPMGEMGHLFVATCLLSPDKTVATYATEIWLRGVDEGSIDSERLGTILGKHEHIEFAPLKRFTDLVVKSLLNVSPVHNRALELMLTALLIELPEIPVKGLKKLLEIYFEVFQLNTSTVVNDNIKAKLEQWKDNVSLSKVSKD